MAAICRDRSGLFFSASILIIFLTTASFAAEPKWITIQNENFKVYSTASELKTRAVLNQFERVRSFFSQLAGAESYKPHPVSVVIFGSEKKYKPFRPNAVAAAYYSNHSDRDFIVMGELDDSSSQFASHEYTHLVLSHAGYSLPPWLNEGLAEFFSTLVPAGSEVESEARSLAEELKKVSASMDFRMRATQILRALDGR
jgi:hypothetical protein